MLDYLLQFEIIFLILNILFLLIILFLYAKKRYPVFSRKFVRFLELKRIKKDSDKDLNKLSNSSKLSDSSDSSDLNNLNNNKSNLDNNKKTSKTKSKDITNSTKTNNSNFKDKTTKTDTDLNLDLNKKTKKEKKFNKKQKALEKAKKLIAKEEQLTLSKLKTKSTFKNNSDLNQNLNLSLNNTIKESKDKELKEIKENINLNNTKETFELERIRELEEAKKQELESINIKTKKKSEEDILKDKEINRVCKQVLIYINAHELDKAQAACIQWLIIDNKSDRLNLELAKIYELKWDYEKAEFIYKDLISQDEDNSDNYRHLSRILNFQWKQKLSYELLKKCYYYSQDKTDSHLLFDLISLALSQNDFDTVDKFSREMLKEYPYHKETLLIYAQSSLNKWNTDKAYDLLNKILQLDPYNEQAKQMMISLSNR